MPQQTAIVKPDASGGFKLPLRQGDVARIDVVDVDLVIQAKDGSRYVLAGAGLEAMSNAPPSVAFTDGGSDAASMLQSVGVVETPDVSIPVMSSLTEHDAKTSAGDKSFHGDGDNQVEATTADAAARAEAQAESQSQSDQAGAPVSEGSDATVEKMVEEVAKEVSKLHDKAADPVPVEPFEAPAAPAAGVGAAPNPVSLTPLLVLNMGNVVSTDTTSPYDGGGGVSGSDALSHIDIRDSLQIKMETITGTGGADVVYADSSSVGGVSYNADGTVRGSAAAASAADDSPLVNGLSYFAKEFSVQISGYFTTLTGITVTISGNTSAISIEGGTENPPGSGVWDLPLTTLTDEKTFKIVYLTSEADAANPVHDSFTLTMNITGVTRAQEFTSSSTYYFEIRDANTVADISQSVGGNAVYVLPAQGVANSISTGDGNDTVSAGAGNDIVDVGAGNDTVYAGYGNDTITGGEGNDVIYAQLGSGGDTILAGNGNNVVYDGGGADTITAGTGDDQISSGAGNDFISAGSGTNVIDGGDGTDTVSYAVLSAGTGVTVNLVAHSTTGGATDTLTAIENVEGTTYADTITGDTVANVIWGLAGDDVLDGGGATTGADTVYGGDGNDTINVSQASPGGYFSGGDGDDSITVSAAALAATFDGGAGNDTFTISETIASSAGTATIAGGDGVDVLDLTADTSSHYIDLSSNIGTGGYLYNAVISGIEVVRLGSGVDSVFGGDGDETVYSGLGNDYLVAGAGNDSLYGEGGSDRIYGGTGDDYLDAGQYSDAAGTILDTAVNSLYGNAGDDILRAYGGADILYGQEGADTIYGGAGNDNLYGYTTGSSASLDGADTLYGEAGTDTLWGSHYADIMDGGEGSDTVNYQNDGYGHHIVLDADGNSTTVEGGRSSTTTTGGTVTNNYAVGDTLISIENLIGGGGIDIFEVNGNSDHSLSGNGGNDTLTGADGTGTDIISGGSGNDFLYGRGGVDSLFGDAGTDSLYGGAGNDYLQGGNASDNYADYLVGGADNDILYGGAGDDVLYGDNEDGTGAGADTLYGEAGADTLYGGAGDDTLNGGDGNDLMDAGAGEDLLYYSSGVDRMDGGADTDTLVHNTSANVYLFLTDTTDVLGGDRPSGITVAAGYSGFAYGLDTSTTGVYTSLTGIENATGNSGADVLVGTTGDNTLIGLAGSDHLYGLGGADTLEGDAGDDWFIVKGTELGAIAKILGGSESDTLILGGGSDTAAADFDTAIAKLDSIECVKTNGNSTVESFNLSSSEVQNIADVANNGDGSNDSKITLILDNGDSFIAEGGGGYVTTTLGGSGTVGADVTATSGVDATYYYYNAGGTTLLATVTVDYA